MKRLIVMSACPGSGKSTWARIYQKTHPETFVISSDEIRFELTGQYQDFSKQKEVWELFEKRIGEYAFKGEDISVILDAVIDLDVLRIKYAQIARKYYDKLTLVVIKKDYEDIKVTNKERRAVKWVPEDILENLYHKFEMPKEDVIKLYDEYIYIDKYFEENVY